MIDVAQRVYRGLTDDPKTERGKRQAALPPDLAGEVDNWRDISPDTDPDALVFPSERGTYLSEGVDPKVAADQRFEVNEVKRDEVEFAKL